MICLDLITHSRLVAIIRLDDLSQAVKLSAALLEGGIVAQEYTLTNPQALQAVARILRDIGAFTSGQATLGVGSVRRADQARAAAEAGAQFLVSPVFQPAIIAAGSASGIPVMCGALTPTEIAAAWDAGSPLVKVFPARNLGADYIKDVLAPMPELKLMPTGGIGLENMRQYFAAGATAVGVGGQLVAPRAIAAGQWDAIAATARKYAQHALPESAA